MPRKAIRDTPAQAAPGTPLEPASGGCACGTVRYRLLRAPMFVHCCHCTRCQRETGGPFAHHAMVEFNALVVDAGTPEAARVPADSGTMHRVMRCPQCRTAMWNEWGAANRTVTLYVRVGTLDEPARFAPQAHIYMRSRQAWVMLDPAVPAFDAYYDAAKLWPPASLERYRTAKAARAATQLPRSQTKASSP